MPDRYLRKPDIAALFGASWRAADAKLREAGVYPVELGTGKIRRKRWLESAVMDAMRRIHEKAQPKPPKPRLSKPAGEVFQKPVAQMSAKELAELVGKRSLASHPRIQ